MEFIPQAIPEVVLIKPNVHSDQRGYFVENYRHDLFQSAINQRVDFVQENESKSTKGVLRGLHFQLPPFAQSKLVKVVVGSVLDVAVDIRKGSPTFGQHVSAELNSENKHQLFIPRGFAHGFLVLSDTAVFSYKVDNYYYPESDRGILFNDPSLGIDWQIPDFEIVLSHKDSALPKLDGLKESFEYGVDLYG